MILALIADAVTAGAREERSCEVLGLTVRTLQRWRTADGGEDGRKGPQTRPANALTAAERAALLEVLNRPAYRDQSPHTIVPRLADTGLYVASESTMYRVLREEGQLAHRGRAQAPVVRETPRLTATGPNQIWSWDITYLPTTVLGLFYYLYLIVDIWSRRIMGWAVHPEESMEHSAALILAACSAEGIVPGTLVLHADNGGPMKGSTMLATLRRLGVASSFSRPRVSDDNPFSEALFRTLKYSPQYPRHPFATVTASRVWASVFVPWYNDVHLHSGIGFVTPASRHRQRDVAVLAARRVVYQAAQASMPGRWVGEPRAWTRPAVVSINGQDERDDPPTGTTTGIPREPPRLATQPRPTPQSGSADSPTSRGSDGLGHAHGEQSLGNSG